MSEACFAATRALCNTCGELTDAKIVFAEGRVLLVKWCPEHGRSEALICSDQGWYLRSLPYIKPQTVPAAVSVGSRGGCPGASCGLCPGHQQHTCVPILEITPRCDLSCPICLVGCGGPGARPRELTPEQVDAALEQLLRCEPRVNMLTLSGGEPTAHPRFLEILERVLRPEIGLVSVSTNGLRLARDDDLIKRLRDLGVVISLQLDGFTEQTYRTLRGRPDLAALKRRVIDRVLALGGRLSLTVTLARGVNEDELAPILELLFSSEQVLSMMVQPLCRTVNVAGAESDRFPPHDPLQILTIPDVVRLLARHSGGVLEEADFTPLPCSHPSCFALTYLLCTADGAHVPLPRVVEPESYLDIIKNQALLNTDADTLITIKGSLYALWTSDGLIPHQESVLRTVKQILLDLNQLGGDPAHREVLRLGTRHIKSIFIHHFMDRYTFDLSRAVKCCNHYPQPDGRLLPACVRNNIDPALLRAAVGAPGPL